MPKVLGRDRLIKRLQALPVEIKAGMNAALADGATKIVGEMKALLSDDEKLQAATDWKTGGPPSGPSGMLGATKNVSADNPDLKVTIFSGSFKAFWARWREFGTAPHSLAYGASRKRGKLQNKGPHHPGERARPYFFSIWRANKKMVKKAVALAVNKAMKEIASSQ